MRNYKVTLIIQAKDLDDANYAAAAMAENYGAIVGNIEGVLPRQPEPTDTSNQAYRDFHAGVSWKDFK